MISQICLIILHDENRNGFLQGVNSWSRLLLHLFLIIERLSVGQTWEMGHVFLILELVNKVHDVVVLNFHQPYLFVNFIVWVIRNDQSELGSTL